MIAFLVENIRFGLRNLILHGLRSLLTALGIIFGVGAVIVMVAIGNGGKLQALAQLERLGSNNIVAMAVRPPEGAPGGNQRSRVVTYGLTRTDVERLRTLPGLSAVVPMRDTERSVYVGVTPHPGVKPIGTDSQIFDVIGLQLSRGLVFTKLQHDSASPVAVLGAKAATQLFPFSDPVGQQITLGEGSVGTLTLTVIGVLEPTGLRADSANAGIIQRDIDMDVYFPLTVAWQAFGDASVVRRAGSIERKQIELTEVWLRTREVKQVESISRVAENVLGLPARADVNVKAPISILRAAEQQTRTFNFIMGGIAAVSLLVGGIGIMNIMLATVTERTKEIGIRRALGAKQRHVILQFLIETTVISMAGGLIGLLMGVTIATYLDQIVNGISFVIVRLGVGEAIVGVPPAVVATWSVIAALTVSGAVGILFGIYPAIKAARMDPIEALRHE